jgi:hypothetical protein
VERDTRVLSNDETDVENKVDNELTVWFLELMAELKDTSMLEWFSWRSGPAVSSFEISNSVLRLDGASPTTNDWMVLNTWDWCWEMWMLIWFEVDWTLDSAFEWFVETNVDKDDTFSARWEILFVIATFIADALFCIELIFER